MDHQLERRRWREDDDASDAPRCRVPSPACSSGAAAAAACAPVAAGDAAAASAAPPAAAAAAMTAAAAAAAAAADAAEEACDSAVAAAEAAVTLATTGGGGKPAGMTCSERMRPASSAGRSRRRMSCASSAPSTRKLAMRPAERLPCDCCTMWARTRSASICRRSAGDADARSRAKKAASGSNAALALAVPPLGDKEPRDCGAGEEEAAACDGSPARACSG